MLASLANATEREEICALVDASDCFDPALAAATGVKLDRLLWVRCDELKPSRNEHKKRKGSDSKFLTSTGFAFSQSLEQVLKVTDLLLQGGGFGMVVLDLGDIPADSVRRIPLTSWFRFRRAVESTSTVLLLIEQEACAKTCASLALQLEPVAVRSSDTASNEKRQGVSANTDVKATGPRLQQHADRPYVPEISTVSHGALFRGMQFRVEVTRSWKNRKPPQSVHAQFALRTAL
jgi:hypothetical protein